ncbi:hypothetical protein CQW23_07704 [Capsicum baccatum]|uniref:Uncharacterized protein n=1 Tax=Capsicum baccatum TaxID=33114 RepID=A0A2G2X6V2_CAPBA|nr:hypothetical protein CQW23_07704 [Capsicum baccatum]
MLISLQKIQMEVENPMRSLLLQGRLCKCLGADFHPYLTITMPFVLKSVRLMNYLSVSNSSDTDDSDDESNLGIRSALLEEKTLTCHMLCCFAAELKEGLHLWDNEIITVLVPMLTFKFSEGVRTTVISAIPLLLQSATSAMRKGLPVTGCSKLPLQNLFETIIRTFLDTLKKESKIQIQARLLEALIECIQLAATAIGIYTEIGGNFLKPHTAVIFSYFRSVMEHPDAKLPYNITAYEVAACGKLCRFIQFLRYNHWLFPA